MNNAVKIEELRKKIGHLDGSLPKKKRDLSFLEGGIPCGCIVEISGIGKTEFVASFLKENPTLRTAWIEFPFSINPYALWQRGASLQNILFLECEKEVPWALGQVLRSQVFAVIIASGFSFTDCELKKFQLLLEKDEANLFLISENFHQSSIPKLQLYLAGSKPYFKRRKVFS